MSQCPNKSFKSDPNQTKTDWELLIEQEGSEFNAYKAYMQNGFDIPENRVNYQFRAINILFSDKAIEMFNKGQKNNWSLDKILSELQVPKEQKKLLLDYNKTDREELVLAFINDYNFEIKIDTTKDKVIEGGYISTLGSKVSSMENRYGKYYYTDERGIEIQINKTDWETAKQIFDEFQKGNNRGVPTQHYKTMTVPGGTNYTENEISTPDIIPSIKGHAQFSTDNGIGWFRSDDKHAFTGFLEDLIASGTIKKVPCG